MKINRYFLALTVALAIPFMPPGEIRTAFSQSFIFNHNFRAPAVLSCDDNNVCTKDRRVSGGCEHTPFDDCTDDGNLCTTEFCDPIKGCVSRPLNCDDGNPCTTDSCNPEEGYCEYSPIPNCDIDGFILLNPAVFH